MVNVFKTNVMGECPGGFCDFIQRYSEVLVVILCLDGFIFFVTLLPPLFSWSNKKPNGRKRIYFAALACFTFYFWLAFLAVNSLYCFGFLAHQGPCKDLGPTRVNSTLPGSMSPKFTTLMPSSSTMSESQAEKPKTSLTPLALTSVPASVASSLASNSFENRNSILPTAKMSSSPPLATAAESSITLNLLSSLKPTVITSTTGLIESSVGGTVSEIFSENQEKSSVFASVTFTSSNGNGGGDNLNEKDSGISSMSEMASSTNIVVVDDLEQPQLKQQQQPPQQLPEVLTTSKSAGPVPMALISWTTSSNKANSSCVQLANEHETQLKNLTLVNILILIVLIIVFIANAREAMTAKALYHKETLCKREEVQRFMSSLVLKPPEVGHLINCFHMAKTNTDARNKKANIASTAANLSKKDAKDAGPPRKVVTFSAIENFAYQTWRDFSDLRLIEPSNTYPIIEIEVVLNFFPGDHFTAEKYKAFVNQMTKTHSNKDQRITIDDYFHVEDHREWTFFIGKEDLITPWWDKDAAKIPLSCIFLLGWPFRMAYEGRIAKHQVEIKKAVFVEPGHSADDEGVSLSATPASEDKAEIAVTSTKEKVKGDPIFATVVMKVIEEQRTLSKLESKPSQQGQPRGRSNNPHDSEDDAIGEEDEIDDDETQAMLEAKNNLPAVTSTASSSNHEQFTEHRVNAVVSQPPKEQQQQHLLQSQQPAQQQHHQNPPPTHGVQPQQLTQQLPPLALPQQSAVAHQLQPAQQQQQQPTQNYNSSTNATSDHQYFYQQMQVGPSIPTTRKPPQQLPAFGHPLANVLPPLQQQTAVPIQQQQAQLTQQTAAPPLPPTRRTAPLRTLREKERDVVVTHQDINGVNTVALKELDVQMTAMSGYETYV